MLKDVKHKHYVLLRWGTTEGKGCRSSDTTSAALKCLTRALPETLFKRHKNVGELLTYFLPLHVGAVGFHFAKGQNILKRILP